EGVHDVEGLLRLEVRDDLAAQALEAVFRQRLVDAPPPDAVLRLRLADDELVLRGAPGVAAGVDDERTALGEPAVAAQERVRVEQRRGGVPVDASGRVDAVRLEPAIVFETP